MAGCVNDSFLNGRFCGVSKCSVLAGMFDTRGLHGVSIQSPQTGRTCATSGHRFTYLCFNADGNSGHQAAQGIWLKGNPDGIRVESVAVYATHEQPTRGPWTAFLLLSTHATVPPFFPRLAQSIHTNDRFISCLGKKKQTHFGYLKLDHHDCANMQISVGVVCITSATKHTWDGMFEWFFNAPYDPHVKTPSPTISQNCIRVLWNSSWHTVHFQS